MDFTEAKKLDEADILAKFKSYFHNNENEIYLDGNSLGKPPKKSLELLKEIAENQWAEKLIEGWNEHWLNIPKRIKSKLGILLNADPSEIHVGDSTSVNLYKLAYAFIQTGKYKSINSDSLNFPSDLYILDQIGSSLLGKKLHVLKYATELNAEIELLKSAINKNPGIWCLSLVSYKSACLYDLQDLNRHAEDNNSLIIWDLSHATGVIDIDFKKSKTRAAVGCTYKFLNGGPGSPAFLYVDKSILPELKNPIAGWFGHANPFRFSDQYEAATDAGKFASGTPSILSMAGIEPAIDIIIEAGIKNIRNKSKRQIAFLIELTEKYLGPLGVKVEIPDKEENRGSHVSISHPEAYRICLAMKQADADKVKVIPDFRPPHYIRLGVSPLYTTFTELHWAILRISDIIQNQAYLRFENTYQNVP